MEKTLPSGMFKNRLKEELGESSGGRGNDGEGREGEEGRAMNEQALSGVKPKG